ncbi:long-chain fatty acid--CoA ligase [Alicyclobacillus cycloheptanicus]|uniref:Fatty-acyl-CoA synthase/feruloyl-CoA synthase n=1 Tax=Alicyclobacillus cycloheptanicus TaxID=1457 RepID=A0ABT9XFN6_9BACL|nr:long-chain fatty acid--CoA ligase [Alicyclobacillus cycloheptanicus]MDQ0189113.1 fatty-acyl-CoA synthase/feruloyl-CoA synthase [Alicyclobacillus cycloheptanicus]WDM00243.1 long-chain fatty acid--CoA ligase [Alicyclobacillus cycloheptanicus]
MPSIGKILERNANRNPGRLALICDDRRYTYRALDDAVNQAAQALAARGVAHGDRVAIMGANSDMFVIAYYALLKLGAITVPTNVRLAPPELAFQLEDAGTQLILHDAALQSVVSAALQYVASSGGEVQALTLDGSDDDTNLRTEMGRCKAAPVDRSVREDDDAQILYTSGTTGRPKGVLLDHHRIIWTGLNITSGAGLREGEVLLHVAPLYHSAELNLFLMAGTYLSATHVVLRTFDSSAVLRAMSHHQVTAFFGVPTMYQFMLRDALLREVDLSAWRIGMFGAAPMPPSVVPQLAAALPHLTLYHLAGLTEMGPGGVLLGGEELRQHPGAAGRAVLNTEARVVNDAFEDVQPGEVGELLLRGETLMKGYWNNPAATAATMRDGWLMTGDLATVDANGLITMVDRKKDMILTGGMNVYSVEVENAIITHPAVADCAVVGVPHADYGETVTAVVALRPGANLTLEELRAHCSAFISDYKVPRKLVIGPVPRNASGKILKYQLREQLTMETEQAL